MTSGHEVDPKEARRKVEEAWEYAKEHGEQAGNHVHVKEWTAADLARKAEPI